MPTALRRLGVFLFCLGSLAVVVGLVPVAGAWVSETTQQMWLAVAVMGGLLVMSGLVMDWLGVHAGRDQPGPAQPPLPDSPPTMRLSASPKGSKGYREDLMA